MEPEQVSLCEIRKIRNNCLAKIQQDYLYQVRNAAKLRAVTTSATYDEFKDIVDSAHLNPLSRADKRNFKTKSNLWSPTTARP